ncbi:hypothetical protein [Streptomyces sp. NPDC051636]|uniref:hypothetical protein n=1 Tax=Streptomyces sp. NPDC051636 TaxID=3365663 RepID=UPI00378B35A6
MATPSAYPLQKAGQDWLLSCVTHAADAQRAWDAREFAELPSGTHWRVAEAPLSSSLQAMQQIPTDSLGPVLADTRLSTAWWLLPPTVTDDLDDLRQITIHPVGWALESPPVLFSVRHRWWVEIPDGSGRLTDPTLLGAVFSPGAYRPEREALA